MKSPLSRKEIAKTFLRLVVHIFRFKGARIVELWDIGMQLPKDSPNEHGAF